MLNESCKNWKKKTMLGVLCRLVFGSIVYSICRARNETKFHGHPKSEEQVFKLIFWEVRTRISGKGKLKKSRENVRICRLWNLDVSVLN